MDILYLVTLNIWVFETYRKIQFVHFMHTLKLVGGKEALFIVQNHPMVVHVRTVGTNA